jgi:hypothetical protein
MGYTENTMQFGRESILLWGQGHIAGLSSNHIIHHTNAKYKCMLHYTMSVGLFATYVAVPQLFDPMASKVFSYPAYVPWRNVSRTGFPCLLPLYILEHLLPDSLYGFLTRLGMPRILLPAAPGDPGALSAPMLNIGGGVAVASLAPNAGAGAAKPPKVGAAAGTAGAGAPPPNAKGELATGVVGAPKLKFELVAGGVGVATAPNPPKTGAGAGAAAAPKGFDAGAAPNPVEEGAGAPKLGAVEPKLNELAVAGEAVVELAPNPPNVGVDDGAEAGAALLPKLKGVAGFAVSVVAGDAALVDPNVNAELAAGFGASAEAPNEKEGFVAGAGDAGAGFEKLNAGDDGVGVALACAGAPKRLGVEG